MTSPVVISWKTESGEQRALSLDVLTALAHEGLSDLSQFPSERGTPVTDGKIDLPPQFTCTGTVSRTPSISNPGAPLIGSVRIQPITYPTERPAPFRPTDPTYPPAPTPAPSVSGVLSAGLGAVASLVGLGGVQDYRIPPAQRSPQGTNAERPAGAFGFWIDSYEDRVALIFDTLDRLRINGTLVDVFTTTKNYTEMILKRVWSAEAPGADSAEFQLTFEAANFLDLRDADQPIPAEVLATRKKANGSQAVKTDPKEASKRRSLAKQLLGGAGGTVGGAIRGALGL